MKNLTFIPRSAAYLFIFIDLSSYQRVNVTFKGKEENLASLKSYIPAPNTPLLGRKKEVEEVMDALAKNLVVTITGTGGVGKTRLSLEICQLLKSQFQDGITFVSLATLSEASAVMATLATALDVKETGGRDLVKGVADMISDKKALLILDNLEQVISAAREIAALSALCPHLKILCTSRTPLKIKAEQIYALHPLTLPEKPDIASLMKYPAIELFVSRAQKANMEFEVTEENAASVLEICRRMDGLPLALELAAARIRMLPPEQLLHRLSRALDLLTTGSKDLPDRYQTLRATIDWSHHLLNEAEQQLFRRLGVFAGGFTLEAVEAVCYDNEEEAFAAIDELESLLDKGMVEKAGGEGRFNLLQTINDYAREQLKSKNEADLFSQRHARYYFEFSQKLKTAIEGKQQLAYMKKGAQEEANILSALDYLLSKAKTGDEEARESGLYFCGDLYMYWHIKGKHQSAKKYINVLFEATEDQSPSLGKCKAFTHLHVATFTLGEVETSQKAALDHYKMAASLKNELEMAKSSFTTAFGHLLIDLEIAKKYSDEAVVRFRKLRHESWLGFALWQNGLIHLIGGTLNQAKACCAESLSLFKKLDDHEGKGCAQSVLALLDFIAGNYQSALEKYQEALSAFEAVGDRPEEARVLSEMSWTYLANKDTKTALKYTLDSIQAHQEVGSSRGIGLSMNGLAAIEAVKGNPEEAVAIAAAAQEFAQQKGVAIEFGANYHGKIYLDHAKKELSAPAIEQAENAGKTYSLKDVLAMVERDSAAFELAATQPHEDKFIKKLQVAIEANLEDPAFGVHQLYEAVSMSQMKVYRKLKALTNQTPSQFILHFRLQKGKELLKLTDQTIAEVAYEVGFSDPNYFSRAFQKKFKQSPRAYRN